jgi:hypothetical protein
MRLWTIQRASTPHTRPPKSTSNILPSKRGQLQFVVVESCEDIWIDTVRQLVNFENFSGVFKEFTVSVSKSYVDPTDAEYPVLL